MTSNRTPPQRHRDDQRRGCGRHGVERRHQPPRRFSCHPRDAGRAERPGSGTGRAERGSDRHCHYPGFGRSEFGSRQPCRTWRDPGDRWRDAGCGRVRCSARTDSPHSRPDCPRRDSGPATRRDSSPARVRRASRIRNADRRCVHIVDGARPLEPTRRQPAGGQHLIRPARLEHGRFHRRRPTDGRRTRTRHRPGPGPSFVAPGGWCCGGRWPPASASRPVPWGRFRSSAPVGFSASPVRVPTSPRAGCPIRGRCSAWCARLLDPDHVGTGALRAGSAATGERTSTPAAVRRFSVVPPAGDSRAAAPAVSRAPAAGQPARPGEPQSAADRPRAASAPAAGGVTPTQQASSHAPAAPAPTTPAATTPGRTTPAATKRTHPDRRQAGRFADRTPPQVPVSLLPGSTFQPRRPARRQQRRERPIRVGPRCPARRQARRRSEHRFSPAPLSRPSNRPPPGRRAS